jgi:hypothetical protein
MRSGTAASNSSTKLSNYRVEECELTKLDFRDNGHGTAFHGGEFIKYEWRRPHGLIITASALSGGINPNDMARIFNTETVNNQGVVDNSNILSPHRLCPGFSKSAGWGDGGRPGQAGENCEPKGNGLMIQALNLPIPSASRGVGAITFNFDPPAAEVLSLGFLNIEGDVDFLEVVNSSGRHVTPIKGLGADAAQNVELNEVEVRSVSFHMHGPRIITHITFCSSNSGKS